MADMKLASVIRGDIVESVHSGHVSIVDGKGNDIFDAGSTSTVTFFRSACKPFQAIPFITSGAADVFGFTDDEIAMASASHSGEPMHVERVIRMLNKAGFTESDLRCGAHLPFNEEESHKLLRAGETSTQLHNNCSGKHAAMLALAKHIDADIATYEQIDHPVQRRVLRCVSDLAEMPVDEISIGIDGCAAPNFAVPVRSMAKSFVNLVYPVRLDPTVQNAAARVVGAMTNYPELIGGTGRLDTMLMRAAAGKVVSKVGADGVWCCGVLPCDRYPSGLGIALKVSDGDDHRGRPVVAVSILKQLGLISSDALPELSPMPIRNRRNDIVGRVESVVHLSW
ncbi:MAG TPA: asparaginase [Pyrinomonadaceae bacterium]|jgi:L-asparaginase II|nr:asparaginase [Pyrinomonadaceae bacterium]